MHSCLRRIGTARMKYTIFAALTGLPLLVDVSFNRVNVRPGGAATILPGCSARTIVLLAIIPYWTS